MEKIRKPRLARMEDAEMGVGTLLIFIAMILVAAVAAGVLVQTAYLLQQQAEATGDQALQEVATGVKVITVYGMTTADIVTGQLSISDLYMKVSLSAGSPVINLIHMIIEITNGYDDESLSYDDVASAALTFDATQVRDTYPYNTWTRDRCRTDTGRHRAAAHRPDGSGRGHVADDPAGLPGASDPEARHPDLRDVHDSVGTGEHIRDTELNMRTQMDRR